MASAPSAALSGNSRRPALPAPRPQPKPAVVPATLSDLEWSVVALAERDSIASLREPGKLLRALNRLFGLKRPSRLANPQLEALRRIAVLIWHHRWNVPKSELWAFLAEGFSIEQYELVQAKIANTRSRRASKRVAASR